MKIRNGFVSNSSSSSFVLIGFELKGKVDYEKVLRELLNCPEEEIQKHDENTFFDLFYDKLYDTDMKIMENTEMGSPRNSVTIFGREVAKDIDEMERTKIFDFEEEKAKLEKIKEIMGADSPVKIYVGNRMS